MWPFHPVLCEGRQVLYVLSFFYVSEYPMLIFIGKRMLKNIVNDKKTVIDKYRQALKTLRDDFLSEVIVTVDMNVFRIITEVASIAEGIKDLGV